MQKPASPKKKLTKTIIITLIFLLAPLTAFASASPTYMAGIENVCDLSLTDSQGDIYDEQDIEDFGQRSYGQLTRVIVAPETYTMDIDCVANLNSGTIELTVFKVIDQDGISNSNPTDDRIPTQVSTFFVSSASSTLTLDATGALANTLLVSWEMDAESTNGDQVQQSGILIVQPLNDTTNDTTPRISLWYGKVNQHNENGVWMTDPDGVSGGGTHAQWGSDGYGDRKLEYCQKFWPNTDSVELRTFQEEITFWTRGNTNSYDSIKDVYECVLGDELGDNNTGDDDNNTGGDNDTGDDDNNTGGDNDTGDDDNNTGGDNDVCTANIELTRSDLGDDGATLRFWEIYGFVGDGQLTNADFDAGVYVTSVSYNGEQTLTVDVTSFVNTLIASGEQYVGFAFRQPVNFGPNTDAEFGGESILVLSDDNNADIIISSDVHGFARDDGGLNANKFQIFDSIDRGIVEYNILSITQTDCSGDNNTGGDNDTGDDDNNTGGDNDTGDEDEQPYIPPTLEVELNTTTSPSLLSLTASNLDSTKDYTIEWWIVSTDTFDIVSGSEGIENSTGLQITDTWLVTDEIELEGGEYCLLGTLFEDGELVETEVMDCQTVVTPEVVEDNEVETNMVEQIVTAITEMISGLLASIIESKDE